MTSSLVGRAHRFFRTARYLRAGQIAHRARLRTKKAVFAVVPASILERAFVKRSRDPSGAHARWPTIFEPLDAQVPRKCEDAEEYAGGRFDFLNETRLLSEGSDWEPSDASQLWRYNLHYFEWAWAFASHSDRIWASTEFRRIWHSWRAGTRFGRWDAWSPYTVSVRAWALCGLFPLLVAGTDDEERFRDSLAAHAGYLRANLERDVGGNHLIKNLKALIGLGVFFGDESLVRGACRLLERQVRVQVLGDGGHFERSPSYHAQVLGDLIDINGLLEAEGNVALADELASAIRMMTDWLATMLLPDGEVPLMNDCVPVGAARLESLGVRCDFRGRLTVMDESGYIVAHPDDRLHLVFDAGSPCPPELPAHAHADTLSFELSVNGARVVVDTGTSTYSAGQRRELERSTAAHNTIEIDEVDSTEVWSVFRAARRAGVTLEAVSDRDGIIEVTACHNGYQRLPGRPTHRRRLRVSPGRVEMRDDLTGMGEHRIVARLHAAPGLDCRLLGLGHAVLGPLQVRTGGGDLSIREVDVARGFGQLYPTHCLELAVTGSFPRRLETVLELQEG